MSTIDQDKSELYKANRVRQDQDKTELYKANQMRQDQGMTVK